jgi:hypothetical protein
MRPLAIARLLRMKSLFFEAGARMDTAISKEHHQAFANASLLRIFLHV